MHPSMILVRGSCRAQSSDSASSRSFLRVLAPTNGRPEDSISAFHQLPGPLLDRGGVRPDFVDPHPEHPATLADLVGRVDLERDEAHALPHLGAGFDRPEAGALEIRTLGGNGDVEPGDAECAAEKTHTASTSCRERRDLSS